MIKINELDDKQKFILGEIIMLSINAGLQRSCTYINQNENDHKLVRKEIEKFLKEKIFNKLSEEQLINYIQELSNTISSSYGNFLLNNRFRIGISQKIINLFIKYIWTLGWIEDEPFHCPIDSNVLENLNQIKESWINCDSIEKYKEWINEINKKAKKDQKSIAIWELDMFNSVKY